MHNLQKYLTLLLLLFLGFRGEAQTGSSSEANDLFAKGKYAQSIPIYRTLLNRFPEDPTFNYRVGVAYFLSNENLHEAYKYLKISSTKEVPSMVYYYLGEVCRHLYRFDESLEYYKRFMMNGGSPDISKTTIEMAASAASNGQNMLKYAAKVTPIATAEVPSSEFYKAYDSYAEDAGFGAIPDNLKTVVDKRKGNKSLIFSKKDGGAVGDISVYASYGLGETNSLDLYYIEKLSDNTWSHPQRLPSSINSPFDESYPYMCADNSTLYFASKGLYSVGGFDIYKATYSKESKEWSAPENLGFPINSPYDDFLFVPNPDKSYACFASSRSTKSADSLSVFKIGEIGNPLHLEITAPMALEMQSLQLASKTETSQSETTEVNTNIKPATGVEQLASYRKIKDMLANNDMLADSTVNKIERLRAVWSDLPDSSRKDIEKLIYLNEKKLAELNTMHSQLTEKAMSMEQDFISGKLKIEVEAKPIVNEWFALNSKLSGYLSTEQLEKLKQSPLRMGAAIAMIDSIASTTTQISDIKQIYEASSGEEKSGAGKKMEELQALSARLMNNATLKWGWFYNAYFEVMASLASTTKGINSSADTTLIQAAIQNNLAAKGIRNNMDQTGDTPKDYLKLQEAYQVEAASLNRLNIFLAQIAGEKALADSIKSTLAPDLEIADAAETSSQNTQLNDFGAIKRDNVHLPTITFSAASLPSEFSIGTTVLYNKQAQIPNIQTIPSGIIFAIQLGSFSQDLNYSLFKFAPMFYETSGQGAVKKVYAGIFRSYQAAQSALPEVKINGFKDAFVVAFADKKATSVAKARQQEGKVAVKDQPSPTASSLMFRVVLGTFNKELPSNIKKIAEGYLGDKEIIRSDLADGSTTFSIGNFDNFEQAISIKDKLISEGLVEAFVTKIDLNQAAQ